MKKAKERKRERERERERERSEIRRQWEAGRQGGRGWKEEEETADKQRNTKVDGGEAFIRERYHRRCSGLQQQTNATKRSDI